MKQPCQILLTRKGMIVWRIPYDLSVKKYNINT